jgi:hypothetical protein
MSAPTIARTHARAPDAPQDHATDPHWGTGGPLPGSLTHWEPTTYTARAALLLTPTEAIRRAATLDPIERAAVLLRAGDAALTAGDIATAARAYRAARHAVECRVARAARRYEAAAIYGLSLTSMLSGEPLRALEHLDAAAGLGCEGIDAIGALAGWITARLAIDGPTLT